MRMSKRRTKDEEEELFDAPNKLGKSTHFDAVARPEDHTKNYVFHPPEEAAMPPDDAIQPESRPDGVTVEILSGLRRLRVRYREQLILVVRWNPQGGYFSITRAVRGKRESKPTLIDHDATFHEAWKIAGEFSVTAAEWRQAFHDTPPPFVWKPDCCPDGCIDCGPFDLASNQRSRSTSIELRCGKCGWVFSVDDKMKATRKRHEPCESSSTTSAKPAEPSSSSELTPALRELTASPAEGGPVESSSQAIGPAPAIRHRGRSDLASE